MKLNEIKVTEALNDETAAALLESSNGEFTEYDTFGALLAEVEGEIILEDLT